MVIFYGSTRLPRFGSAGTAGSFDIIVYRIFTPHSTIKTQLYSRTMHSVLCPERQLQRGMETQGLECARYATGSIRDRLYTEVYRGIQSSIVYRISYTIDLDK